MASGDCSMSSASRTPRKQKKWDIAAAQLGEEELNDILKDVSVCQNDIDSLAERSAVEILNIERQYNKLRKPLYEQRAEKISGVPNFWLRVLASHPDTKLVLLKEQLHCLRFLTKIEVEDNEDIESGYWIKFYFSSNPYFENEVLVKQFNLGTADTSSSSTKIEWKEGMNLIEQFHGVNKGNTKRCLPASFFHWFFDNSDPLEDHIASVIKEDIWPNPLEYCTTYSDDEEESTEDEDEDELDVITEEGDGENGAKKENGDH